MNKRVNLFIYGDVIGVGFRSWTESNARNLGLVGWVRNTSKDRVEAIFEGPTDKIEEMLTLCKKGPEIAWVEKADVSWENPTGEFSDFTIR